MKCFHVCLAQIHAICLHRCNERDQIKHFQQENQGSGWSTPARTSDMHAIHKDHLLTKQWHRDISMSLRHTQTHSEMNWQVVLLLEG